MSPNDLGAGLATLRPDGDARGGLGAGAAAPAGGPGPQQRLTLDVRLGHAAPDRLTFAVVAYLVLPGLLFLGGWAEGWATLGASAAAVAALALLSGGRRAGTWPFGRGATALLLALGLVWAVGTGALHLLYSTADWQLRDAVLRDLAAGPWPVAYREPRGGGTTWLLRAPLGYFLPAGLVGRGFGIDAARWALWAWSGLGLALVLGLIASLARTLDPFRPRRAAVILAATFVLFHGLDILPNMVLDGAAGAGPLASWGRGGEWWARLFQYPGHVAALLWAPNHALPAWLAALLLLRHWQAEGFARIAALPLAAAAFWSPVAAGGAALLTVAALAWRWGPPDLARRALLAPVNWLSVAFAVPLCLYLLAGAAAVPHGPLLGAAQAWPPVALGRWALFLAVEVLPWALLAALLVRPGVLFGAAVAILCLLPGYVFGPGNEMTSRGGLAPLAVLAVAAGAALLAPALPGRGAPRLARAALRGVAVLALAGSVMEGSLLVAKPAWPASEACSVPEAARQSVFQDSTDWSHYLAPWPEPSLEPWMEDPEERVLPPPSRSPNCWPEGRP